MIFIHFSRRKETRIEKLTLEKYQFLSIMIEAIQKYRETNMKKVIVVILTLLTALSLCACDSKSGKKASAPATGSDLSWEEIEKLADERLAAEENG